MKGKKEEIKMSEEQGRIINKIKENKDLIIMSNPGSGKTTTALLIARENKDKKILILTYNRGLMEETINRV